MAASPSSGRASQRVQHNPTPHISTLTDNMADDEKEKAEKVAAAKKRVCIIFHVTPDERPAGAHRNQHSTIISLAVLDIAGSFPV